MKHLVLASIALLLSMPCIAVDAQDQAAIEAAALFRVILATETNEKIPERCQYGSQWALLALPAYVAKDYFGLTLHADLLVQNPLPEPRALLDPENKYSDIFCSDEGWDEQRKKRFSSFESDKTAESVTIKRTQFSFPIFDATYAKAAIVVSQLEVAEVRNSLPMTGRKMGELIKLPAQGVEFADLYLKKDGVWMRVRREVIGQS